MADSSFKYTHNGSASGYSYSNGKVSGSSPYTVGGHPIGTYTVGGQPAYHAPSGGVGSRLTGNPSGGIGILQNLGGQIADTIHSIPNAVVQTAEQLKYDFGKGGTESLSQAWNDPRGLIGGSVKPQVEVSKQDASALRKGDWHYFEQHPLNPILDVAAIASLGGKGALIGAKTGALGKGAQDLATSERVLQVGDHSEILNQSETLQGRARQRAFDAWSQAHPDVSVIGGHERMLKILNKRVASMTLRAGLPVRAFQRLTNGLTPPEVFAFHVGVEGVPLDDRIAYYQRQLAEGAGATRYQAQYLQNLMAPDVRAVLENPRPEFTAALHAGSELEAKAGARLVAAGSLTPETRIERAGLPQMEMMGHADLTQNLVHPDFPSALPVPPRRQTRHGWPVLSAEGRGHARQGATSDATPPQRRDSTAERDHADRPDERPIDGLPPDDAARARPPDAARGARSDQPADSLTRTSPPASSIRTSGTTDPPTIGSRPRRSRAASLNPRRSLPNGHDSHLVASRW